MTIHDHADTVIQVARVLAWARWTTDEEGDQIVDV